MAPKVLTYPIHPTRQLHSMNDTHLWDLHVHGARACICVVHLDSTCSAGLEGQPTCTW